MAAGIAALTLAVNPDLTRQQVHDLLIASCDKIDCDAANYLPDEHGRGYSSTHGYGRINAARAVKQAQQLLTQPLVATSDPREPAAADNAMIQRTDEVITVNGQKARKYTIGTASAFVLEEVWAVLVGRGDAEEVAKSLRPENVVEGAWAQDFRQSGTVLVGSECARQVAGTR